MYSLFSLIKLISPHDILNMYHCKSWRFVIGQAMFYYRWHVKALLLDLTFINEWTERGRKKVRACYISLARNEFLFRGKIAAKANGNDSRRWPTFPLLLRTNWPTLSPSLRGLMRGVNWSQFSKTFIRHDKWKANTFRALLRNKMNKEKENSGHIKTYIMW